ncbi:MAG: hypothetical protein CMK59_03565 [Proteobacteria bacterium]|nr:hypothetical protein [Pseudomonadota bacterium]
MSTFQTLEECPNCLIEAVLVETYNPALSSEAPISRCCPFCDFHEENGNLLNQGKQWSSVEDAADSIKKWALSEGEHNPEQFCQYNLGGISLQETAQRLHLKQPISSSFDLLQYLFSGMFHAPMSAPDIHIGSSQDSKPLTKNTRSSSSSFSKNQDIPIAARALASVMLADGQVLDIERRVLDNYLSHSGASPLKDSDIQSWLPIDLPIPKNPEQLLNAMMEVAFADEELDETEWRLIREYARHWSCDLKSLEAERKKRELPKQSKRTRIWRALKTLFFTETP